MYYGKPKINCSTMNNDVCNDVASELYLTEKMQKSLGIQLGGLRPMNWGLRRIYHSLDIFMGLL